MCIVTSFTFWRLKVYFRNEPLKIQKSAYCNLILNFVVDFKSP
jgi:hypothetical protein